MLEEFRNKKVKLLVGSNSGVAVGDISYIETSIIRMRGIITDYDNEFIKLNNIEMVSANQSNDPGKIMRMKLQPDYVVEKSSVSLVNRKNILTISLIEE